MIYQKRGKFCFNDANGRIHKFKTEEEAAKAAGLGAEWEMDHGSEKAKDSEEAPTYGWQVEAEEVDAEEQEVIRESESGSEEEV